MPSFSNTPESVLPRSDSRNPASTCRGINVNGKPCRRTLAAAPTRTVAASGGVVAMLKGQNHQQVEPTSFFCWQHKNQATQFAHQLPAIKQAQIAGLAQKTSIDSLAERFGILDVNAGQQKQRKQTPRSAQKHREHHSESSHSIERKSRGKESSFCCFKVVDNSEALPAAKVVSSSRHKSPQEKPVALKPPTTPQRPVFVRVPRSGESPVVSQRPVPVTPERWPSTPQQSSSRQSVISHPTSNRSQYLSTPTRPSLSTTPTSHSSKTAPLLSLIPQHLSPQTTALLLAELAKPISDADEDGYIYIFWVTPQGPNEAEAPPGDIALNLLPPPGRPSHSRRTSDALRAAQTIDPYSKGTANQPGSIRLKIGRTSNVHRRLNQWSKQCSHNLTLIRYYPYNTSSPSPSPARRPDSGHSQRHGQHVPHVHRVERLIHIELSEQRVRGQGPCSQCGKEHREWFEINATKDALRLVDDCVRRWVSWGEQHA